MDVSRLWQSIWSNNQLESGMREVAATDAKAHLAELLRAVEYGETVAIARHGKTVAG